MLVLSEVVPYLLQRRLLSSRFVVENDLTVSDISRRNRNFTVTCDSGPAFLLKQDGRLDGRGTIVREAVVYDWIQTDPASVRLRRYLPRFYDYNLDQHILILEFLPETQSLREYHLQGGCFSVMLARKLGKALGILHHCHRLTDAWPFPEFHLKPPWVLSLHQPALRIFQEISSAGLQLIKIVQSFPEFCHFLDALRQDWQVTALIHNDIKGDNCLVPAPSPSRRKMSLKFIDWELAGLGDPCWDVGSVFGDYLSYWLLSIPITGDTPADQFVELAYYPLEKIQPAIRSFWQAYACQMKLDETTSHRWLLRATQYGAARLVQTAFEQTQLSIHLPSNVIYLLQASLNMLQRPEAAIVHLLGISLSE